MRIVHGELSGRKILVAKSLDARPTTDVARGALFNILLNRFDFENIRALDLFSGTGCISYEFASLGCPDIVAVERDRVHCEAIRKNLELLRLTTIRLIQTDVFIFLKRPQGTFDIIVADPPFSHPAMEQIPGLIAARNLLKPDGCLILEHGSDHEFQDFPGWKETREYGKVHFSFFIY